ncbi:MAG: hypothetical protein WC700_04355 [Gemmatimonadaceae bacterium]
MFNLVLRDERFDQHFTASDFLRHRLDAIREQRAAENATRERRGLRPLSSVQPTFTEIQQSHLLFVQGAYRPYVATASEYSLVKASGDGATALGASGANLQFTFPIFGQFTSDIVLRVRFRAIGSADAAAAEAEPTTAAPLLRYCAYPGLRLLRSVSFKSAETLIDDYTTDDAVAYSKFFVGPDHRLGWLRCHGQQVERQATYRANNFTGVFDFYDGPQTPKLYQEELELFIPLQFWFCRDASTALLNDMIPNTQRTITCDLAPLSQIVFAYVNNPDDAGELVSVPLPFSRLDMTAELYVNGLYVNPEVHDVYASRCGFSLFRAHRRAKFQLPSPSGFFQLDSLKFPAEFLLVGMRDRRILTDPDIWWLMGTPTVRTQSTALLVSAMIWNKTLEICQHVCREAREVSTLESFTDTFKVTAHGVDLYPTLPSGFFNAYLPTRYAESTLVYSPRDSSAFLVTFCLYPGVYNPSGYYNLSAGRELYINYALKPASVLSSDFQLGQTEMVISMSALNFLVRRGDTLSLQYAL